MTRTLRSATACVSLVVAILALGAASASAAITRPFEGSFATGIKELHGLSVDSAGNLYVLSRSESFVARFDPAGNPVPFAAGNDPRNTYVSGNKIFGAPDGRDFQLEFSGSQVAVDRSNGPTSGYIYVAASGRSGRVEVFDQSGAYVGGIDPTTGYPQNGLRPCGVAVDPTNHDVYLAAGSTVEVFEPVDGDPAHDAFKGRFKNNSFCELSVGANGTSRSIYAAQFGFPSGPLYRLDLSELGQAAPEKTQIAAVAGVTAVDPSSGDVYVDEYSRILPVSPSGVPRGGQLGVGQLDNSQGLAFDSTGGRLYVSNAGDGTVSIFGAAVVVPDAATGPVTNPTETGGVFTGSLGTAGAGPVESCSFEYGPDNNYGSEVPCSQSPPFTATTKVSAPITGLTVEQTVHYRLKVSNADGTNYGFDRTFTPHVVVALTTEPATELTPTSARLNGSFLSDGDETKYSFEWGTEPYYGNTTPSGSDSGSVEGKRAAFADLESLTPDTVYHYRITATDPSGTTSYGEDVEFRTPPTALELLTEAPDPVADTSATLRGSFTGTGESTQYFFEWGKGDEELPVYTDQIPVPPFELGPVKSKVEAQANLTGLEGGTEYNYRIVATTSKGTTYGRNRTFFTVPSAPVATVRAGEVSSDSAVFSGQLDPGGGYTTFRFEYASDAEFKAAGGAYTKATPQERTLNVGAPVAIGAEIGSLEPATVYHWRFVAENSSGSIVTADRTFKTSSFVPSVADSCPNALARRQTGASALFDCRAYELVSAANAGGYDVTSYLVPGRTPYGSFPRATNPSRVLYAIDSGGIPGTGEPTNKGPDPYVATRGGDGWTTAYVGIPSNIGQVSSPPFQSGSFSSIASGADDSLSTFAFGAPGGCSPCFADGSGGIPVRLPSGALVQGMAGSLNPGPAAAQAGFVADRLSADGSHLVFGSTARFEPAADGFSVTIYSRDLLAGTTQVVSTLPSGATMTGAEIGELAVSADGARVVVAQKVRTDSAGNDYWHPYLSLAGSGASVDLAPGTTGGVLFDGMTADGSAVFFTTKDALVAGDSDGGADIYRATVSGASVSLTRVSSGSPGGSSDACEPVANSDGPHWNTVGTAASCDAVAFGGGGGVARAGGSIYFLSPELLGGAGQGVADQPNLYVAGAGGSPQFLATLDPDDAAVRDAVADAAVRRTGDIQVTPAGDLAAMPTAAPLLGGYDNAGFAEIYRFGPSVGARCVSCDPSEVSPTGAATLAPNGLSLTDDGRVFFTTGQPLVPRDSNRKLDAYEWENGGIELVSAGTSSFDSGLLGATADGRDAYFFTRDSLAPQDPNGPTMKVYDARSEGGFFVVPPPQPCQASDECHGAGAPAPGPPNVRTVDAKDGNVVQQKKKKQHKHHKRKKHRHHKRRKGRQKKVHGKRSHEQAGRHGKRRGA